MIPQESSLLIISSDSDNPFAMDVAAACRQTTDIYDIIALKSYANSEFCPRFISDEGDMRDVGNKLKGKHVVLVTTHSNQLSRNELAWRNMLVARAAKDNGAENICLVEPDLFYSAQDRGPRPDHGNVDFVRSDADYKKFDGQPFSSRLYAQCLALAGVDTVVTVQNHSDSVQRLFEQVMPGGLRNLNPARVYADYIRNSDVTPNLHSGDGLLVCAPDKGAREFAVQVFNQMNTLNTNLVFASKERRGERNVEIAIDPQSPTPASEVAGKDVIVFDDMVRTGVTIRESCRLLKELGARRVVFFVTHFYSSPEGRENLAGPEIDEIVTTNTIPSVLNRDMQGRLRRKLTVLKLERWVSRSVLEALGQDISHLEPPLYSVDMSSKNPRHPKWREF